MQQLARDDAGNVWELDASGQPTRLVEQAGASQAPQPYTIGTPDPAAQFRGPKAATDLQNSRLSGVRTQQEIRLAQEREARAQEEARRQAAAFQADLFSRGLRIGASGQPEPIPGWKDPKKGPAATVDPAAGLQRAINDMRARFRSGPGATTGFNGILDFLPSEGNREFDRAAQAARGYVGPALGLTASQLNTEKEADRAIGPYIPTSTDYDSNILAAFDRLQGLANDQRRRAGYTGPVDGQAQMAQQPAAPTIGVPPPQQGAIPGARGPNYFDPGTGPGGPTLNGGGGTQTVVDPTKAGVAARLNQLLKSGASDAQVQQYAASVGADPASLAAVLAFRKQNPGYTGNYNASDLELKDEQVGLFRGAVNSAAQSGVGAYFLNAADGLTAGTLDNMTDNPALARAGLAGVRQAQPGASLLGTISGAGLAAGGAELGLARAGLTAGRAALAGDALYGAAYGAGSADEGNRFVGAGVGAAGGALGGIAGRAAARGIGSALTGVRNADVQGLRAAGVPLTVGQAAGESGLLGRAVKGVEDRLSGIPVVGDMVNARRTEGFQGFNRAAFDEALAPIGANTGGTIAEPGIDAAQAATRQGYRDALDGVSVSRDPQFTGEYNAALAQGAQVPRVGPEFEAWARAELDPLTAQPQFNGATVQDFLQQTRGADFGTDAMGNLVGRSVTGAEDAMRGLVSRQAPDVLPALGRADQAFRQTQVLRDAVNRARNGTRSGETGTFTPSQLADAAAANAKRFGNSQGTTRQPFFDLSRAGQRVLPNSVPDSGTAGRAVVAGGLGLAGLGGGAGYAAGDAQTGAGAGLLGAAALALGGSRAGQRALTAALLDRPEVLIRLGEGVQRQSRIGGLFGAPMLAGGAVGLTNQ